MTFDSATVGWAPQTTRVLKSVLDLAGVVGIRIRIEMFSPARRCPKCRSQAEVFVEPGGMCAACWGLAQIPRRLKTDGHLARRD